jgi:hypothetical protein
MLGYAWSIVHSSGHLKHKISRLSRFAKHESRRLEDNGVSTAIDQSASISRPHLDRLLSLIMSDKDPSTNTAAERLNQINSHIKPNTKSKRGKANRGSALPADWSDVLEELDVVKKYAQTPKYETTGYKRQKEGGKLWVRERIELLLDAGSFEEVGSAAGTAVWMRNPDQTGTVIEREKELIKDFTPSNNVQGQSLDLLSTT